MGDKGAPIVLLQLLQLHLLYFIGNMLGLEWMGEGAGLQLIPAVVALHCA